MADFDGDSTLDILVVNRNEGQIFRLKHDPNNFLYLVGLPTYLSQLAAVLTVKITTRSEFWRWRIDENNPG